MGETRALLDAIVTNLVIADEQKDVDLNAAASDSAAAMESAKSAAIEREFERANTLAPAFEAGLRSAWAARQRGRASIDLDDRDPAANAMADALIQYLVSYGLAASSSVESEPSHYTYTISVDWDRLSAVASAAGIDLGTLLTGEGPHR